MPAIRCPRVAIAETTPVARRIGYPRDRWGGSCGDTVASGRASSVSAPTLASTMEPSASTPTPICAATAIRSVESASPRDVAADIRHSARARLANQASSSVSEGSSTETACASAAITVVTDVAAIHNATAEPSLKRPTEPISGPWNDWGIAAPRPRWQYPSPAAVGPECSKAQRWPSRSDSQLPSAVHPPSTVRAAPLMNPLFVSSSRNRIALATSSGAAKRPMGTRPVMSASV